MMYPGMKFQHGTSRFCMQNQTQIIQLEHNRENSGASVERWSNAHPVDKRVFVLYPTIFPVFTKMPRMS